MLGNLAKNVITDLAIPSARDNLSGLVSNLASNAINKIDKNMWNRSCQSRKRICYMNDIIKIIKSVEDSNVLTDGITETVKHETKKQED